MPLLARQGSRRFHSDAPSRGQTALSGSYNTMTCKDRHLLTCNRTLWRRFPRRLGVPIRPLPIRSRTIWSFYERGGLAVLANPARRVAFGDRSASGSRWQPSQFPVPSARCVAQLRHLGQPIGRAFALSVRFPRLHGTGHYQHLGGAARTILAPARQRMRCCGGTLRVLLGPAFAKGAVPQRRLCSTPVPRLRDVGRSRLEGPRSCWASACICCLEPLATGAGFPRAGSHISQPGAAAPHALACAQPPAGSKATASPGRTTSPG